MGPAGEALSYSRTPSRVDTWRLPSLCRRQHWPPAWRLLGEGSLDPPPALPFRPAAQDRGAHLVHLGPPPPRLCATEGPL